MYNFEQPLRSACSADAQQQSFGGYSRVAFPSCYSHPRLLATLTAESSAQHRRLPLLLSPACSLLLRALMQPSAAKAGKKRGPQRCQLCRNHAQSFRDRGEQVPFKKGTRHSPDFAFSLTTLPFSFSPWKATNCTDAASILPPICSTAWPAP